MRWTRSDTRALRARLPDWRLSLLLGVLWLLVALPTAVALFLTGSRATVVAGHDAVVRPSLDGYATVDLGPYLPSFRYPSGSTVGARIDLGKTTADSYSALIQRYAFIASRPEAQVRKVTATLTDLAVDSAVDGALVGLAAPAVVLLVGGRRWAEIGRGLTVRRTAAGLVVVLVAATLVTRPWDRGDEPVEQDTWQPITDAIPGVPVPDEARPLQIESGLITSGSRRLVESAIDSYQRSTRFYGALVDAAPTLEEQLHQPEDGETVGLLVSDRHDNIGMDPVARAIADQGKATFLLDAELPTPESTVLRLPADALLPLRHEIAGLVDDLNPFLALGVPALTLSIGRGASLSEDPADGHTFGEHRCALLARAVLHTCLLYTSDAADEL